MTDRSPDDAQMPPSGVRPSWSRSRRPIARRVVQPLQAFLEAETSSAILLLGATIVALLWANSPFGGSYERFWSTNLMIGVGDWAISYDLRGWVSNGLMTLFFLVVGLEIKRELLTGELRERRAAFLPVAAAVGGMVVPAAMYVAFTSGSDAASGFGMAMPTDVVFALSVLTLARRLPAGLKALLLALAIVDDLGSIVVVAFADRDAVNLAPLAIAVALLTTYGLLWRINVRAVVVYVALGVAAWVALGQAGVSPTLAGVALGFLTPAVAFQRPQTVSGEAHRVADQTVDDPDPPDADAAHWLYLGRLSREAVSPLARAEAFFLPWASYVVVPLFALAFAGIDLSMDALAEATNSRLGLGIVVSRLVGKPVGVALAVALALWLGAALPTGVRRWHVIGLGAVAGIPFTVSLYIAQISLPTRLIETATVAIVLAAVVSGILGYLILRFGRALHRFE
jgi:NhaA family Na+:H+ antiporter